MNAAQKKLVVVMAATGAQVGFTALKIYKNTNFVRGRPLLDTYYSIRMISLKCGQSLEILQSRQPGPSKLLEHL